MPLEQLAAYLNAPSEAAMKAQFVPWLLVGGAPLSPADTDTLKRLLGVPMDEPVAAAATEPIPLVATTDAAAADDGLVSKKRAHDDEAEGTVKAEGGTVSTEAVVDAGGDASGDGDAEPSSKKTRTV